MATYRLKTPLNEEDTRRLRVGDIVYLTGLVVTARDAAHRRMIDYVKEGKQIPVDLRGGVIYHCGPVVEKVGEEWRVLAAGPTTSTRMEIFEADVIEKLGVKMVIGKGGMGSRTAEACRRHGAVYAYFTGGAGVLAANAIKRVRKVEWLDLGIPEALWFFDVEDFGPLLITIDSTGRNLTDEVVREAYGRRDALLKEIGAL